MCNPVPRKVAFRSLPPSWPVLAPLVAIVLLLARSASAQAGPPKGTADPKLELPGAPAATITLSDAIERMKRDNLELIAARFDLEASRADIVAAGVLPNPNLGVDGGFLVHGAATSGQRELAARLEQNLPLAGQIGLRKDVARGFASAAERDFAATAWILAHEVRGAYVELQAAQSRWRILSSGVSDLERVESIVAERAAAGANPAYDRVRVGLEKNQLMARLAQANVTLGRARSALARAMGRRVEASSLAVEEEIPEPSDPPADLAAVVQRALMQRLEIQAERFRVAASQSRVQQIRREYVPSPTLVVGYRRWFDVETPTARVDGGMVFAGLNLPLPLFDHGQGKVDRAAFEADAARTRVLAAELEVRREVEQAVQEMSVQVSAWRKYRDSVVGEIERLRAMADVAYRLGKSGILEALDAYRSHLEARERATELKAAAYASSIALERALGPSVRP